MQYCALFRLHNNLSLDLNCFPGRRRMHVGGTLPVAELFNRPGAPRRVLDVPAAADRLPHVAAEASMQFA